MDAPAQAVQLFRERFQLLRIGNVLREQAEAACRIFLVERPAFLRQLAGRSAQNFRPDDEKLADFFSQRHG